MTPGADVVLVRGVRTGGRKGGDGELSVFGLSVDVCVRGGDVKFGV